MEFDASSWPYVAIRFVQLAAVVVVLGVVAMREVVLAGRGATEFEALAQACRRRIANWGLVAIVVFGAASVARAAAQYTATFGVGEPWTWDAWRSLIAQTSWGLAWLASVAGAWLAGWALTGDRIEQPSRRAALSGACLVIGGSLAVAGHPVVAARPVMAILIDIAHLIGAGGWIGSLALLVGASAVSVGSGTDDARHAFVAELASSFSPVALVCASILLGSGLAAGWRNVGDWHTLWQSPYGHVLRLKLMILSVVVCTGAYNWRRVLPLLGAPRGTVRLRRSATIELGGAVIVLVVTAVLVATPLPTEQ